MKQSVLFPFFLLLIGAFLLSSCNPARKLEKGKLRKKSESFLLKKLEQNQVEAEWFSGKAKIDFSGEGQRVKASANIQMRKDSVIWMNVKKLSIEAARVQITPDSIYLLNRLTREFGVWDLTYLKERFNLPLDFADLQALFLGNAVMVDEEGLTAEVSGVQHVLQGNQAGVNTAYQLNALTYFLEKILIADVQKEWLVEIDQGDYGLEASYKNFPYFRNFNIQSEDTGPIGLEIKFTKIDLNVPQRIRFEIPSRYTRVPQ